ncbi:hypothetical protein L208DRAFT_1386312 [Tricholoma matsutake]|nr:hypothetical protein L208DRAFT_1386312 [Tricholoma matsutake 945]
MARGLPPSPPKFGRNLPGKVMEARGTPSRSASVSFRGPSASPLPPTRQTGRIQARKPDGSVLGFVRNTNSSQPISGFNFWGPDQDLFVSFTASASGQGPFDIVAINAIFSAPFYVGASAALNSSSIGLKNSNAVAFSNVEQTPPDSIPVASTFGKTVVESAIWSFDPSTRELKAQYVNPDSTKPATVIAYDNSTNFIFFVGDINAFNSKNSSWGSNVAFAINLFLV